MYMCIAKFYSFACDEYNSISLFILSSNSIIGESDRSFVRLTTDSIFGTKLLPVFHTRASSMRSSDLNVSKTICNDRLTKLKRIAKTVREQKVLFIINYIN